MDSTQKKRIPVELQRLAERWAVVGELTELLDKVDPQRKLTNTELSVMLVSYGLKFEVLSASGEYNPFVKTKLETADAYLEPTESKANASRTRS